MSQPSRVLSTVHAWYAAVAAWDFDALADLFDDAYRHETIPAGADDGVKNKEQGLAHARAVAQSMGGLPLEYEIFDYIESGNRVWAHSRLYARLDGQTVFSNESIFLFTLTEGVSPRITAIREFVDTQTTNDGKRLAEQRQPK